MPFRGDFADVQGPSPTDAALLIGRTHPTGHALPGFRESYRDPLFRGSEVGSSYLGTESYHFCRLRSNSSTVWSRDLWHGLVRTDRQ